jgi:hypothetical protein
MARKAKEDAASQQKFVNDLNLRKQKLAELKFQADEALYTSPLEELPEVDMVLDRGDVLEMVDKHGDTVGFRSKTKTPKQGDMKGTAKDPSGDWGKKIVDDYDQLDRQRNAIIAGIDQYMPMEPEQKQKALDNINNRMNILKDKFTDLGYDVSLLGTSTGIKVEQPTPEKPKKPVEELSMEEKIRQRLGGL